MIALFLIPVYIVINVYILHRLKNFLIKCKETFSRKWLQVIIYTIYGIFAVSPIVGFLMPYGTETKRVATRVGNYWFALLIYTIIIVAIGHFLSILLRRVFKITPHNFFQIRKNSVISGILTLAIIGGVSAYGLYNARDIKVTDYNITVNKQVENVKSMKVVLLADLHMGYSIGVDQIEKMVKLVNEQKPDLVCIAGDIYDNDYNSLEDPDKLANLLSQMKSTYGTYACWGNHDVNQKILAGFTFSTGKTLEHDKRMDSFFKKAKINLLTDEVKLIDNKFYIAGRLDDEKPATGEVKKSADELLKGLDKSKPIFTIYHEPNELDELSKAGTDVLLCGHTHDGQIFPGNIFIKLFWENACGYLKKGNMHNIVTSGVGIYGPYIRVGTHAEICPITVNFK